MTKDIPSPRILRMKQLTAYIGVSRSRLYFLVKEGRFPRGIQLSDRCVGWRIEDVDAWIAARSVARAA